jgi:hypothetical protein
LIKLDTAQSDALITQWGKATHQGAKEDISDYVRRCRTVWDCLVAANHPRRGDEQSAIRHICHGLDQERYGGWKVDTANKEKPGAPDPYPSNFDNIAGDVSVFIDPFRLRQRRDAAQLRYIYQCTFCNKDGHDDQQCYRKHPELMPAWFADRQKGLAGANRKPPVEEVKPDVHDTKPDNITKKKKPSKKKNLVSWVQLVKDPGSIWATYQDSPFARLRIYRKLRPTDCV